MHTNLEASITLLLEMRAAAHEEFTQACRRYTERVPLEPEMEHLLWDEKRAALRRLEDITDSISALVLKTRWAR